MGSADLTQASLSLGPEVQPKLDRVKTVYASTIQGAKPGIHSMILYTEKEKKEMKGDSEQLRAPTVLPGLKFGSQYPSQVAHNCPKLQLQEI